MHSGTRAPARPLASFVRARWHLLVLAGIVALALFFRLYGINWDQGGFFHPDERAILTRVHDLNFPTHDLGSLFSLKSPWDPHWFPYGSFPLYLLKFLSFFIPPLFGNPSLHELALAGRAISALFDTLTIVLVYVVGARTFGKTAGLVGAALIAFSALHIQQSHFFVTDIMQAALLMASFGFLTQVAEKGSPKALVAAGALFGLALATKVSSAPFAMVFAAALALYYWHTDAQELQKERLNTLARGLTVALLVGLIVFLVAEPYALLNWHQFGADVGEQGKMVRRIFDYPYTRQYAGTTPYLYQIKQLTVWGMGISAGLLLWVGFGWGLWKGLVRRSRWHLLVLSWAIPYFLITGYFQVKFLRYLVPLTPFLALLAGEFMVSSVRWVRERSAGTRQWRWRAACGVFTVAIALTLYYAASYVNIYAKPHTAKAAEAWLNANVQPGTTLLDETPWEISVNYPPQFPIRTLDLIDYDTQEKRGKLIASLAQGAYIVMYDQQVYAMVSNLPERYLMTIEYYRLLFSGQLGFELAHWESSYPNLLGVSIVNDTFAKGEWPVPMALQTYKPTSRSLNLGFADESFVIYDHPLVLIFKKTLTGTQQEQLAFFNGRLPQVVGQGSPPIRLQMSAEEAATQQVHGTWSALFHRGDLINKVPWLFWVLVVQLAFLVTLPITLTVFRALPDRGYLLGKMLGVVLVAYIPWLLASLRWMAFSRASIALGMLLLAALSYWLFQRKREEFRAYFRENRRLFLTCEGVFLLAFSGMYLIRVWNPDLWHPYRGGEKPMDFAYFNAVVRSTYMPPYDPWYSGGFLNYYYFGQFMNATLDKFTGIVPSKAITLTTPLFFAMTAAGAFSVVYNLAALMKRQIGRLPNPVWAGLLAVVLVCCIGNLDGVAQVSQGAWRVLRHQAWGGFDYWRSSRLMPPDPPGFEITEFPFFSFLFADPHAHVFVIPLTVLAVGLALAIAVGTAEDGARLRWLGRTSVLPIVVLGMILGTILATNSWDVLVYAFIGAMAVVTGEWLARRRFTLEFLMAAGVKVAAVAICAFTFYFPYVHNYKAATVDPNASLIGGAVSLFARTKTTTEVWQYLAIHAIFIAAGLSLLGILFWRVQQDRAARRAERAIATGPEGLKLRARDIPPGWSAYAGVVALVALGFAAAGYSTIPFLVAMAGIAVGLLWHTLTQGRAEESLAPQVFVLLLLTAALGVGIFVDLFVLNSPTEVERMNTVFKFYLQAWVLFGLAGAFALWRLEFGQGITARGWRWAWQAGVALLLIGSLIYPVMATPARARDRFNALPPTTDGMAYMDHAVFHDLDNKATLELRWDKLGIEWLQDNVQGSPVIVEGLTPLYRWGNRVTVYTGLPAVIGWDWHQKQQRWAYQYAVDVRRAEVANFYNTTDVVTAIRFLDKYKVSYIYVGQMERSYYSDAGLAKFPDLLRGTTERVYSNEQVSIYRVLR